MTTDTDADALKKIRGERFKAALIESGIKQTDLAQMLGVNHAQTVAQWTKRGVAHGVSGEVAKILAVSRDWLDGKSDTKAPVPAAYGVAEEPATYNLQPLSLWDSSTPLDDDELELRLYKEVELSSGPGCIAHTEVQEVPGGPKLRFARSTLRICSVDPSNAVFATNSGNSNHPLILNGATLGIDKGLTRIIEGEIYALDHGGVFRVKFLSRLPGGGIRMSSYNAEEHPPEDYAADQILEQRIIILGRIFWWSSIRPLRSPSLI